MASAEVWDLLSQRTDVDHDGCISSSASAGMFCRGACLGISWCKLAVSIRGGGWMVL